MKENSFVLCVKRESVLDDTLTLSTVNCFEHFRFCSFLNIIESVRQKST